MQELQGYRKRSCGRYNAKSQIDSGFLLATSCGDKLVAVGNIYDMTTHRALDLFLIDAEKLFFDVTQPKQKDEGKEEKQFERQYKKGDTKRYNR